MTKVNIPSEYYDAAASALTKFGLSFNRNAVLSVKWAQKTGQYLAGYIAPKNIGGDENGNFYIDDRIPLSLQKTESECVRVVVDGDISIQINVSDFQHAHLFQGEPNDGASEIHRLEVIGL